MMLPQLCARACVCDFWAGSGGDALGMRIVSPISEIVSAVSCARLTVRPHVTEAALCD